MSDRDTRLPLALTGPLGPAAAVFAESGIVKLASGTITTPLAYIDLPLPEEYLAFELSFQNFLTSDLDSLTMVASFDGSSFVSDNTNFDSYISQGAGITNGVLVLAQSYFTDALASFAAGSPPTTDLFGISGKASIFPGESTKLFSCLSISSGMDPSGNFNFVSLFTGINPFATVSHSPARATKIRLLPYGNADANPPTSGHTIIAGSYVLWGISP